MKSSGSRVSNICVNGGSNVVSPNKANVFGSKALQGLSTLHNLTSKNEAATLEDATECQENLANLCVLSRKAAVKSLILRTTPKQLLLILRRYRSFPSTLQSVCDLVWSLAYHDPQVQAIFAETGVCGALLECAKANESCTSLLKSAFGALSSLCRHPLNQDISLRYRLVPFLVRTLANDGYGR